MRQGLRISGIIILTVLLTGRVACAEESGPPWEPFPGGTYGDDVSGNDVLHDDLFLPEQRAVFSVKVPESLDFVMDPYELEGRGSIWSQEYSFVNEGETPVKICLSKLHCIVTDDVVISESGELTEGSGKQAVLWLRMDNGDAVGITERDSAYEFTLDPQEALIFWICGEMSADIRWESGDISLSVLYRLETPKE